MANKDSNTTSGFALYGDDPKTRLLLPFTTAAEISEQVERAARAAAEKVAVAEMQNAKIKPVIPLKKRFKVGSRDVEIFPDGSIDELLDNYHAMDAPTQRAGQRECMGVGNGRSRYRTIPSIKASDILALADQFENMAEPIRHLAGEIELMAHLPPRDFNITPILLLGEPGIGKTAFAIALSKVTGLRYKKLTGSEPSFTLTGSHPTWIKAAPGMLIKHMAAHDCAAPLFLVDEIDKQSGERYPITTALLDLLEPENAREFKDEFFQISFNASHAIWILTANTIEGVAAPLLSRMGVFDIPTPGVEQRKRIIEAEFNSLRKRTGAVIGIETEGVMALAGRLDLDLRKVTRIVRDGFIAALGNKKSTLHFELPTAVKASMGFM